jgi:hypothetical protein
VEAGAGEKGGVNNDREHEAFEIARERAITLVRKNFGSLSDLGFEVAAVVWVTTFRACEMGVAAERGGGPHGLLRNMLVGDRKAVPALREHAINLEFLNKAIPQIRDQKNPRLRADNCQLLIDCLKWNIVDAASYSALRRSMIRIFVKADSLYKQPIPCELVAL